jgi:hypothetical protein
MGKWKTEKLLPENDEVDVRKKKTKRKYLIVFDITVGSYGFAQTMAMFNRNFCIMYSQSSLYILWEKQQHRGGHLYGEYIQNTIAACSFGHF